MTCALRLIITLFIKSDFGLTYICNDNTQILSYGNWYTEYNINFMVQVHNQTYKLVISLHLINFQCKPMNVLVLYIWVNRIIILIN